MAMSDKWYRIDETTPKNKVILLLLKEHKLSVRGLAKKLKVQPYIVSWALNKKRISKEHKERICKFFGLEEKDIFEE